MSNIINAIINLVNDPVYKLKETYTNNNRANNAGDALEEYTKDLFAGSLNIKTEAVRLKAIANTFSYTGNNNNPPDAMLHGGDAIEIKKIESKNLDIALNSSYPKHKLSSKSPMLSNSCKNAEKWEEKDIIYVVGHVYSNQLKSLCMVYGLDYCADIKIYEKIQKTIHDGIKLIQNIDLIKTKELGKLKRVDPLGITYLRIRGMWGIENPWKVFSYVYTRDENKKLNFMCIINDEKWKTFDNTSALRDLEKTNSNLTITDIEIKDPNNPATLNKAKLIQFSI